MLGSVGILNVGAGDTKLTFDPSNPRETARAAKIVNDMLRRGYALLIQVGTDAKGKALYQRAEAFDEATCEYIIADFDESAAGIMNGETDGIEKAAAPETGKGSEDLGDEKRRRGRPARTRRIKASETRAVAVAHSAGG